MAGNVPYKVPVGPIHPALKEPGACLLTICVYEKGAASY